MSDVSQSTSQLKSSPSLAFTRTKLQQSWSLQVQFQPPQRSDLAGSRHSASEADEHKQSQFKLETPDSRQARFQKAGGAPSRDHSSPPRRTFFADQFRRFTDSIRSIFPVQKIIPKENGASMTRKISRRSRQRILEPLPSNERREERKEEGGGERGPA